MWLAAVLVIGKGERKRNAEIVDCCAESAHLRWEVETAKRKHERRSKQ